MSYKFSRSQSRYNSRAVKRLSADLRARHSEIPRPPIAGMPNRLVHAYDAVDLDEVRRTLKKDIPDLQGGIDPLLPSEAK